jgi:hypothetical protein
MKIKIVIALLIIALAILIFPKTTLESGKYMNEDSYSFVEIKEDGTFIFLRNIVTSYRPNGEYEINGKELLLIDNDEQFYRFKIDGKNLYFLDSHLEEEFIEPMTKYTLSK